MEDLFKFIVCYFGREQFITCFEVIVICFLFHNLMLFLDYIIVFFVSLQKLNKHFFRNSLHFGGFHLLFDFTT